MKRDELEALSKDELVKLAEELLATEEQKTHLSKLADIGKMSNGITHEVNNSIAVSHTCLFMLKNSLEKAGVYAGDIAEIFEKVQRAMERVLGITSQMNQISKKEDSVSTFSVKDTIESIVGLVENSLKSKEIGIEMELAEDVYFLGSEIRFQQVVLNLINNSMDAMADAAHKNIKIRLVSDLNNGILTIQDSGVGIPEDLKVKIFESFYTSKKKGTGLGLSSCKSFIEEMNGFIDVESEEGSGATFVIKVPVSEKPQESTESAWQGDTLLLNGDVAVTAVLKKGLERNQLNVMTSNDGIEALEYLDHHEFNVIFVSYELNNMNGLQFIQAAKNKTNASFVVLFKNSIDDLSEASKQTLLEHIDAYLVRPYPEDQIKSIIEKIRKDQSESAA